MNEIKLRSFYDSYIDYLSSCVHALITHRNSKRLQSAKLAMEDAAHDIISLKRYNDTDMLFSSMLQLSLSIHQITRTGFSPEVRGMLHHPLEDMLGNIIQFVNSIDAKACNDPMICILEDQIDALSEIHHESLSEAPQDAGNIALLLCHLKDMALCLHCLSHMKN